MGADPIAPFDPKCEACPLHEFARCRCVPGIGSANPKLILVGERPGQDEDRDGKPFVGRSGRFLNRLLRKVGLARDDLYITNLVKCYSARRPGSEEIETCQGLYLDHELKRFPGVPILVMGAYAAEWVGGQYGITDAERTTWKRDGRTFIGAFHPAAVLRGTASEHSFKEALFIAKAVAEGNSDSKLTVLGQAPLGVVAADCETTGLYRHLGHKPFLVTIATRRGAKVYRIPEQTQEVHSILDAATRIGFWNRPFDHPMFGEAGIKLSWEKTQDVRVKHALNHDNDRPFRLKPCAFRHLGIQDKDTAYHRLHQFWAKNRKLRYDFLNTPQDLVYPYAAEDSLYTLALDILNDIEPDTSIARVSKIEHEIQPILVKLYEDGIGLDVKYTVQYLDRLAHHTDSVKADIERTYGINPASYLQINRAFEAVGIKSWKFSQETGKPSFDEEVLSGISHPLAGAILKYRGVKNLAKFLEGWLRYDKDGRLYVSVDQMGTETGRFSGSEPYLMNVPDNPFIRRCLVPRPGHEFWSFDWSQLQLRLFAEFARDEKMIQQLIAGYPKYDPYQIIAQGAGVKRDVAKAMQLAVIFGAQGEKLSKMSGVPEPEMNRMLGWFSQNYRQMADAPKFVMKMLEKQGYVESWLGRRRRIGPDGYRQAVNFIAQGGEADLLKVCLLRVDEILRSYGYAAKLTLIVHDQIILDVPPGLGKELAPKVWAAMTQGWPFRVPLDAKISHGKSFGTLQTIKDRKLYDPAGAARL